jgi:L-lactate permease
MAHNGVDIDQYLLLILYPSIAFFVTGFITKKKDVKKTITYIIQAIICFIFSISYYLFVPSGGAEGLALVLGLFGILLLILARKEKINPSTEEEGEKGGEESKVNDEEQERQREMKKGEKGENE